VRSGRTQPRERVGEEPDPRFTFANERTFLAWNRTALALIAAGAAAAAFLRSSLAARLVVALPLVVLGSALAVLSYRRWQRNEIALRLREPLPTSRLPVVLSAVVAVMAIVIGALAVADVLR
jgi:putative membrane protein